MKFFIMRRCCGSSAPESCGYVRGTIIPSTFIERLGGGPGLKKENGDWCNEDGEMQDMAAQYFKQVFQKDDTICPSEITDLFDPKITDEINAELCKPYSAEEIGDALFQIGPLKAPGPDGLPARFFQRNWPLLKDDVIRAV